MYSSLEDSPSPLALFAEVLRVSSCLEDARIVSHSLERAGAVVGVYMAAAGRVRSEIPIYQGTSAGSGAAPERR